VAERLLKGMTYKQCAAELHISQNTVKFHALNAYRKAGVTSRGELMTLFLDDRAQP
jgi:DNA-binding CsgD family transcriptional regulator